MYYYLHDCPNELIDLSEQVFGSENEFQRFLLDNDINDTRTVSEAKWKRLTEMLQKMVDELDEDEDDY
jgi:hypothetical protein